MAQHRPMEAMPHGQDLVYIVAAYSGLTQYVEEKSEIAASVSARVQSEYERVRKLGGQPFTAVSDFWKYTGGAWEEFLVNNRKGIEDDRKTHEAARTLYLSSVVEQAVSTALSLYELPPAVADAGLMGVDMQVYTAVSTLMDERPTISRVAPVTSMMMHAFGYPVGLYVGETAGH